MRTEATPERVAKLPAWAQDERTGLLRRVSGLEAEVAALRAEPGALDNSPFDVHTAVLDPYHHKVPVGHGHVRYTLPPGEHRLERYIDARYTDRHGTRGAVELMASAPMVIHPIASNVIVVDVADD